MKKPFSYDEGVYKYVEPKKTAKRNFKMKQKNNRPAPLIKVQACYVLISFFCSCLRDAAF